MKAALSFWLYQIGHIISVLMRRDFFAWLYPLYNKIMNLSCELDEDGKVWKIVNEKNPNK